jgi:outer membrane protein, multidrug efflux system
MRLNLIFIAFCTMVLGACSPMPLASPPALPAAPVAFKEATGKWIAATPSEAQPRGTWWKVFADYVLDDLIERANQGNTNIKQAASRLEQARVLVRGANANRSIQVGANASASRQGGTLINAAGVNGTLINTSINLSYETDFFGRLSKAGEATRLDAKAREALMLSARLVVQTDVAQTYFSLRGLDNEIGVLRAGIDAQQELLQMAERRARSGLATEIDAERVRAALASVEFERLTLERQRAQLEHALAVLIGEVPSAFSFEARNWAGALPAIPPGIPSALLARRADVSAAQASMLAAQARLGAADAAWFPSLSLTGSSGYASPELSELFRTSLLDWAIGAALSLPLFDGGRREAALKGASADLELQYGAYREQILVAFRDVEDQLSALRLLAEQAGSQERAVTSAMHISKLSDSRFRSGLTSKQEVLDARQVELLNLRKAVQVRSTQFQTTVGLVKALGGSW